MGQLERLSIKYCSIRAFFYLFEGSRRHFEHTARVNDRQMTGIVSFQVNAMPADVDCQQYVLIK